MFSQIIHIRRVISYLQSMLHFIFLKVFCILFFEKYFVFCFWKSESFVQCFEKSALLRRLTNIANIFHFFLVPPLPLNGKKRNI